MAGNPTVMERLLNANRGYREGIKTLEAQRQADAARIKELEAREANVLALVARQAEDEGLWFIAHTAAEAYLQQELRKLHAIIEAAQEPPHARP